jgi:hypothetical protein
LKEFHRNLFLTSIIERLLPTKRIIDRPKLDDTLLAELSEYLKDDAKKLREFSGMDFPYWSV